MKLKLDLQKLEGIMHSIYTLTGFRFVIFDHQYNEILAYPAEPCKFCARIRTDSSLLEKCRESDLAAFERCSKSREVFIYNCHAGLVEACTPIKRDGAILGYIMFGQVGDTDNRKALEKVIGGIGETYGIDSGLSAYGIKYKSKQQILAASKLLEICTEYLMLKDIIEAESSKIITDLRQYIDEHLGEDIKIGDLCSHTGITRTKLYEIFGKDFGMGIARYIKLERLKKARFLLKTTDYSITEISSITGFSDYNYFGRVFKEQYGISPTKFRKQ